MRKHLRNFSIGFLAISAPFFAVESRATPWGEIEEHSTLTLKKSLSVEPGFTLDPGQKFFVIGSEFIGPINVQVLTLRATPCTPELSSRSVSMVILENEYGFEMNQNCKISTYIEMKDYYRESLFDQAPQ